MDNNGLIDFKEFLLAIDVTSSGSPEKKLSWAFRYYHGLVASRVATIGFTYFDFLMI